MYAATREQAIDRMLRAIADYRISGVQTTLPFCAWAIDHEAFRSGNFDTHFVSTYFKPGVLKPAADAVELEVAALAAAWFADKKSQNNPLEAVPDNNNGFWRVNRTQ